jgi:putative membrane protein insertion efficiency factor
VFARAGAAGAWLLLAFVRFYQVFLSPFLGGACKFYPSCSNYTYESIARHGSRRGFALAVRRLGRCRPFTQGGFDPVPDEEEETLFQKPFAEHTQARKEPAR